MKARALPAALLLAACAPVSAAAGVSGVVTLASEYVYRGQATSAHDPALSLGLDYEHESGLFGGVWASTIDLESPFGRRRTELDYYLGYRFEPREALSLSAALIRYTYPGHTGTLDYEHTELLLAATLQDRYTLEFAWTDDVYGRDRPARHWAIRGEWPAGYWVVSAGLGISDLTALNTDRYLHWDAGASIRWSRLTLDLRWYDNEPIAGPFARWSAGARAVASVSLGF